MKGRIHLLAEEVNIAVTPGERIKEFRFRSIFEGVMVEGQIVIRRRETGVAIAKDLKSVGGSEYPGNLPTLIVGQELIGETPLKNKVTRKKMLFHITQTHAPELCPKDEGGSSTLYDPNAKGVKFLAMYGAFPEHVIYYIVEAESVAAVNAFLHPGFKRCTSRITPVSQEAIEK